MFVPPDRPVRFRCPLCAAASDHPRDAAERYCGRCGFVAEAVARRAADRGWTPGHPPLAIGLDGADGRGAQAWLSTAAAVPLIGLSAQVWRALLLPAQVRLAVDLLLAHCEARAPGLVEPLRPGGRGAPHGWGREPPGALEMPCVEGGPLALSAGWPAGAPEPELAIRPGHWGGCRLGLSAVRLLDDWSLAVLEARDGGAGPRLRPV